jgi:hypothetical protein
MPVRLSSLQQQNFDVLVFGQTVGEDATSRAGADNDVVVIFHEVSSSFFFVAGQARPDM